jgi:DNA-binding FrmR family transcriptional regulator
MCKSSLAVYPLMVYNIHMHGINKDNKKIIARLKKIAGQVSGIEKMVLADKYCIDIITQTSAIKSAISSLEDEMLESHLSHCLYKETNKNKLVEMQKEIIKVYKLKRK